MDSFEWNKIIGAVLFSLLVAFGLSIFAEIIFETEAPESPGYVIAVAEEGTTEEAAEPESQPIAVLLASADPGAGESSARKCAACHTFGQGEANKIGPNLWGVVGRPVASHEGYTYSDAMHAFSEQTPEWDYESLNHFLTDPDADVPGTKMAFPGIKGDAERANVIAYLRSLSESPLPLPDASTASAEPEGTAAAEETAAAPAEESAAAGEEEAAAEQPAEQAQESAEAEAGSAPAAEAEAETEQQAEQAASEETPAAAPGTEQESAVAEAGEPAAEPEDQETAQTETAAPAEPEAAQSEPAAPEEQETAQTESPAAASEPAESAGAAPSGFAAAVAAADVAEGEKFARRCAACHTFEEGGATKVGPNLWGVVNRPIASVEGYDYSDAMVAFSEDHTKVWDYETLSGYLTDPRGHVPGTKMIFPGVKAEADRANVIAYLRSLAAEPAPLQ